VLELLNFISNGPKVDFFKVCGEFDRHFWNFCKSQVHDTRDQHMETEMKIKIYLYNFRFFFKTQKRLWWRTCVYSAVRRIPNSPTKD